MKYAFINGKVINGKKDMTVQNGLCVLTDGEKICGIVE